MKTALDLIAGWIVLDIVLIAAWHLAHVRSRRFGAHVLAAAATQRVYTVAPQVRLRDPRPALVRAGRG